MLSKEQDLFSIQEYAIGSKDQRGNIFRFLESRIYDRENINVLLLMDEDCLKKIISEARCFYLVMLIGINVIFCSIYSVNSISFNSGNYFDVLCASWVIVTYRPPPSRTCSNLFNLHITEQGPSLAKSPPSGQQSPSGMVGKWAVVSFLVIQRIVFCFAGKRT